MDCTLPASADGHEGAGSRPRPEGQDGFTLVEVLVAVVIVTIAVVSMTAVLSRSFASVGFSRQDQQAVNLASSTLAQVEALPWQTAQLTVASGTSEVTTLTVSPLQEAIRANDQIVVVDQAVTPVYAPSMTASAASVGATSISLTSSTNLAFALPIGASVLDIGAVGYGLLGTTDSTFSADTNIVAGTGGWCFEASPLVVGGTTASSCTGTGTTWAQLPVTASCASTSVAPSSAPVPLYPHHACVVMDGTTFEIAVYPTQVGSNSIYQEVQVTVAVSWSATASPGGLDRHVTDTAIVGNCGSSTVRCS